MAVWLNDRQLAHVDLVTDLDDLLEPGARLWRAHRRHPAASRRGLSGELDGGPVCPEADRERVAPARGIDVW